MHGPPHLFLMGGLVAESESLKKKRTQYDKQSNEMRMRLVIFVKIVGGGGDTFSNGPHV